MTEFRHTGWPPISLLRRSRTRFWPPVCGTNEMFEVSDNRKIGTILLFLGIGTSEFAVASAYQRAFHPRQPANELR